MPRAESGKERKKLKRQQWTESEFDLIIELLKKPAEKPKKPKTVDLSSVKAAIGDVLAQEIKPKPTVTNNPVTQKGKRKAAVKEINRMQKIVQNDAFISNPLAAIQTHLKNTFKASRDQ